MSEEDDNENEGFMSSISSTSGEYLDLLGELRGDEDELDLDSEAELKFIVRPSAEEVADLAEKKLRQEVDDESQIPFEDPRPVIREAERQMMMIREAIIEKIENIKRKEEESVSGADIDTMLYIVDKSAGKTGKFTVIGGARSFVYKMGEEKGVHPYESELILNSNKIGAWEKKLYSELLLDTVFIFSKDMGGF